MSKTAPRDTDRNGSHAPLSDTLFQVKFAKSARELSDDGSIRMSTLKVTQSAEMNQYLQQPAYIDLRSLVAERTKRLVAWTGAGLSAPAGVPTWNTLRHVLTEELEKKARTIDEADQRNLLQYASNAKSVNSLWDAFKVLKQGLGEASFKSAIKKALEPANGATPPVAYEYLWKLDLQGLINLNIDRLATRAFAHTRSGRVTEFNSKNVGDYTHVLNDPHKPFIFNAHGVEDEFSSWVFTKPDLLALLNNEAYTHFIKTVLGSFTVLFVGISADDQAAGGHLEALRKSGIQTGPHYWITDRTDGATDRWAEERGIRIVRYANKSKTHAELEVLFKDLLSHVQEDEPVAAKPITFSRSETSSDALPSAAELVAHEPELIRLFLNAHAKTVLQEGSDESYKEYMAFMREYDRAILNAWYVEPPDNVVLGYQIQKEEARGAFGHVYRATANDGQEVAVKILLNEIRRDENALVSFRRGVSSMRILKERNVSGMVEYLEAAEIPAMVVMEWVDGENLREAIISRSVGGWPDLLRIGYELSKILREAHSLPERVLHRDLRPANIMLEGLNRKAKWSVKVLDFDLSWHRGANERTLVHSPGTTGYLAPEQIEKIEGVSTRHSAVDSFGLGMTLYFMMARKDPFPNQHMHIDWARSVHEIAEAIPCPTWHSLPTRFARLVLGATSNVQAQRHDMTAMNLELKRLLSVLHGKCEALDLIVEEMACRSEAFVGYKWSDDNSSATIERPSGVNTELRVNEVKNRISLTCRKYGESRKGSKKNQDMMLSDVKQALTAGGWQLEEHKAVNLELNIVAHIRGEIAAAKLEKAVEALDKCDRILRFKNY